MPQNEHLVLCGGVVEPAAPGTSALNLNIYGESPNVTLKVHDISRRLVANIPDELADLLEIASYVYAADSAVLRGGKIDAQMGARWRRKFRFVVPVRHPDLWTSIHPVLIETLSFLSDDEYDFEFKPFVQLAPLERCFEFTGEEGLNISPHELILFSGGLDSFAGTVEELVARKSSVILVSHRSASKIVGTQKHLVRRLSERLGPRRVFHVPVWANFAGSTTRKSTYRTRSFLVTALGAVTARLFRLDRITFFENGIVSLNLPPLAPVVGARATRVTHPQVLEGFCRLLSEIVDRSFEVANPYRWHTKAEVIEQISVNGFRDLIRDTRSCAHVRTMSTEHPHCGLCSQCIDRRFAVLAAGLEQDDPIEGYKVDLFTGERPAGPGRELALAYVRSASDITGMTEVDFFSRYGEASRALRFFEEPASTVARLIHDLHRRHAAAVCRVVDRAISENAARLREGTLPPSSLLRLIPAQPEGEWAYPKPDREIKQPILATPQIRLAIDRERVFFDRWGPIRGVGAELLIALAEPFREAMKAELTPENFPFTKTSDLVRRFNCKHGTLRRRVYRCRNEIARLAAGAGESSPSIEAVIENLPWRGYRLNPDRVKLVALTQLSRPK